ncbi:MAG: hypothetical protein WD097_01160 [Balneolales bacterium]
MSREKRKNRPHRRRKKRTAAPMLLTSYNYKLLAAGGFCVVLGFGGMYIDGTQYGIYSLYLAPLLVTLGFILVAISVFKTDPALVVLNEEQSGSDLERKTS